MAQHVVFRPNREQRALLREPPLPYVVQVVPWATPRPMRNPGPYTDSAAELIERSAAFQSVLYTKGSRTAAPGVTLFAESSGDHCNTAIIPIFTILTLGLFPTIFTDVECSGAVFRRADGTRPQDSVVVRIRHRGPTVMGWVAAPLGLLPAFSYRSARGQKGYHQAFRLAIIAKREELAALAAAQ
jgi:hypothetical protein